MVGIRQLSASLENVCSIGKENESIYHNSGSGVSGLNVFCSQCKVGLDVSNGERWGRESHELGELLAYSHRFLQCWGGVSCTRRL